MCVGVVNCDLHLKWLATRGSLFSHLMWLATRDSLFSFLEHGGQLIPEGFSCCIEILLHCPRQCSTLSCIDQNTQCSAMNDKQDTGLISCDSDFTFLHWCGTSHSWLHSWMWSANSADWWHSLYIIGQYLALRLALLHGLKVALLACQNLKSNNTIKGAINPV